MFLLVDIDVSKTLLNHNKVSVSKGKDITHRYLIPVVVVKSISILFLFISSYFFYKMFLALIYECDLIVVYYLPCSG